MYFLKKKFFLLTLSFFTICCKKENHLNFKNSSNLAVIVNPNGLNFFSNKDFSNKSVLHLDYGTKIEVLYIEDDKKITVVNYKNQKLYTRSEDIEIFNGKEKSKSIFSKDCYCIQGLEKSKILNFPTKYDTITYYYKENKLRTIKYALFYRLPYEEYNSNSYNIEKYIKDAGTYIYFNSVDKNDIFNTTYYKTREEISIIECYNTKESYGYKRNMEKPILGQSIVEDFNYSENLFNLDLCYAKMDNFNFVNPSPNINFKNTELLIDQTKRNIGFDAKINLYSIKNQKLIPYKLNYISFKYLREFKMVKAGVNGSKCFVKIDVQESFDSSINGEYYIDLKEVANFAEIAD
ncbi:hypothetical protein [Flavobacterium oreochromis]|uniref:Uncharacterized protein n=1 Tax=Flavobacterium columnare TaxID=996 RepID=A0A2D0AHP3_9FLAO|nr:hypothetical protein [Flavobacterium oreochromis]OWP75692.1 hypothetical protein BWK62_11530 [Flavobacterium oreochromis]POR20867.1 hypothetical protein BWK58_13365 [Flavobacterium columnare]